MKSKVQSAINSWHHLHPCLNGHGFRIITMMMLFAFLNLVIGCSYKVNTLHESQTYFPHAVQNFKAQEKLFIVHFGDDAWWLRDITFNVEMTELHGTLEILPDNRYNFYNPAGSRVNPFTKKTKHLLEEVHIHALEYSKSEDFNVVIPVTSIQRMDVYKPDIGRTMVYLAQGLVIVVGAIGTAFLIYVLAHSCPFIYTYDGERFAFAGEVFSGAKQPGLERHDYLRLPALQPADDEYLVMVSNELREIQHINLMQLKVIDHPEGVDVLADKQGQFFSISEPLPPLVAKTLQGTDITELISEKDAQKYHFNDAARTDASTDGIILSFPKPPDADEAKLIISAKNSMWLDYVLNSFHEMFGRKYKAFDRKQGRAHPEDIREMMINQGFPLNVYLEKDDEWVLVDFFEVAGPMAMKDDILAINLEGVASEMVNIKLETGFMFWEIDYAAMDFSVNMPLEITTVMASEALDEAGNDVREAIRWDDDLYYVQPEVGNMALLRFPVPELTGESRTIILHSKGYYKVIRDYTGMADRRTLRTFREPGRMPLFSKELYEDLVESIRQQ